MSQAMDRLVAVMDRLRSPGGCPWDAAQTHASLVPYLLEEAYELAEAVDLDDRAGLREELGDVLLHVLFHARVAQDDATDPFDLDDVADGLTAKLVRRHPHVFADQDVPADLHAQWDRLKRVEKPERTSALDGVPGALPALARARKLAARARRAGLDDAVLTGTVLTGTVLTGTVLADTVLADPAPADPPTPDGGQTVAGPPARRSDESSAGSATRVDPGADDAADAALGQTLLDLVLTHPDLDAEGALRRATRRWETRVRQVEVDRRGDGDAP